MGRQPHHVEGIGANHRATDGDSPGGKRAGVVERGRFVLSEPRVAVLGSLAVRERDPACHEPFGGDFRPATPAMILASTCRRHPVQIMIPSLRYSYRSRGTARVVMLNATPKRNTPAQSD